MSHAGRRALEADEGAGSMIDSNAAPASKISAFAPDTPQGLCKHKWHKWGRYHPSVSFVADCLQQLSQPPTLRLVAGQHWPVGIVGAGPTGLTLSILLSHLGIEHAVFDRAGRVSNHPQVQQTWRPESPTFWHCALNIWGCAAGGLSCCALTGSLHQQSIDGSVPYHGSPWACQHGPAGH